MKTVTLRNMSIIPHWFSNVYHLIKIHSTSTTAVELGIYLHLYSFKEVLQVGIYSTLKLCGEKVWFISRIRIKRVVNIENLTFKEGWNYSSLIFNSFLFNEVYFKYMYIVKLVCIERLVVSIFDMIHYSTRDKRDKT